MTSLLTFTHGPSEAISTHAHCAVGVIHDARRSVETGSIVTLGLCDFKQASSYEQ